MELMSSTRAVKGAVSFKGGCCAGIEPSGITDYTNRARQVE